MLLGIICCGLIYLNLETIQFKNSHHLFQSNELKTHVRTLSHDIGERNIRKPLQLQKSADYIIQFLRQLGLSVKLQKYLIQTNKDYLPLAIRQSPFYAQNIYVTINSDSTLPHLVVGAHYDTFIDTPGADDNASSIAVLLEIIKYLTKSKNTIKRPVHFVFFTLEEPPFFKTNEMGSYQFAKMLKSWDTKLVGMISLDCVGYFSNQQSFPFPLNLLYSQKGDFLSIISTFKSYNFYKKVVQNTFQNHHLKIINFSLPRIIPGVDYSDHWSFEQFSYPSLLFTDSAFYRSNHYHENSDTFKTLNYIKLAEFTEILSNLIQVL